MNKTKKILILLTIIFALTGCIRQLKEKDNPKKIVENPETGQKLVENIICQPEDATTIKLYEDNGIVVTNLPKCSSFSISGSDYEGIWTTLFIKPLAWLIIKIGKLVGDYGLSIIIITIMIRAIMIPVTKKNALQAENLKKIKPELDQLEKKFANKTDNDSKMLKSQEMMMIYKKNNISPMSGCLFQFLQIPLFLAFYESLSRLPAIYETNFLFFQLGTSPRVAVLNGQWYYAITVILIFVVTFYSFKLNPTASMSADQEKQMKLMMNIFIIFIVIASITMPTCIALYWITNNTFTVIQNLIIKRGKTNV